jgi:hypothetical protein
VAQEEHRGDGPEHERRGVPGGPRRATADDAAPGVGGVERGHRAASLVPARVSLTAVIPDRLKDRVKLALQELGRAPEIPDTSRVTLLALSEYARRHAGDAPGGAATLPLALYELRVFSQNGEDGVLAEIIQRIGAPGTHFVEFGTGPGVENNCVLLADVLGWSGLFIEAGDEHYAELEHRYRANPRVATEHAAVTPENVEALFARHDVPEEPDVLSVDIDGGEYYIWEALEAYRPRILVSEYNGELEPGRRLVQPRAHSGWDQSRYYGASIEALVALGERKGYRLVHTELTGNNAFFVRADLPGEFPDPAEVVRRRSNFFLGGQRHAPDPHGRPFIEV